MPFAFWPSRGPWFFVSFSPPLCFLFQCICCWIFKLCSTYWYSRKDQHLLQISLTQKELYICFSLSLSISLSFTHTHNIHTFISNLSEGKSRYTYSYFILNFDIFVFCFVNLFFGGGAHNIDNLVTGPITKSIVLFQHSFLLLGKYNSYSFKTVIYGINIIQNCCLWWSFSWCSQ